MKTLLMVTILAIFVGCASQNEPSPSQNKALNTISNSNANAKQKGYMQEHLDSWLQNDWEKNTKEFEETEKQKAVKSNTKEVGKRASQETQSVPVAKSFEKNDESFTLQHYVDKIKYYTEHHQSPDTSHVEKLKKMPVIGE